MDTQTFRSLIWDYYHEHGRDLPWRTLDSSGALSAYKVVVSEIMLQQTQAARVVPKYHEFLDRFPDVSSLANASLQDVLTIWSGLGYNRRAKYLWQAAQQVAANYGGTFPDTMEQLIELPGIGRNTAGAVLAYAFNRPAVFIETNIRTVYIYHFFSDQDTVSDSEIQKIVAETVSSEHPRDWYWALMDYGVYLKSTVGNVSRSSKHYVKQSAFQGSKRQIRGQVIKLLTANAHSVADLQTLIPDPRLEVVIQDLVTEKLIVKKGEILTL